MCSIIEEFIEEAGSVWVAVSAGLFLLFVTAFLALGARYVLYMATQGKKYTEERLLELQTDAGVLTKGQVESWPKQPVEITSRDGLRLRGMLIEPESTVERLIILVHGFTASSTYMFHFVEPFRRRGWAVLLIDQRYHGKSEGHYATYGFEEKHDLDRWVEWAVTRYGASIHLGLLGQSMGGGTVLEYASINKVAQFIVADCPYSDVRELLEYQIRWLHHFPPYPLLWFVNGLMRRRAGFSLDDVKPIRSVEAAPVPIMFVHGADDKFVPTYMSEKMFAVRKGKKKLLIVPGAAHARAFFEDRDLYEREMMAFVEEALVNPVPETGEDLREEG